MPADSLKLQFQFGQYCRYGFELRRLPDVYDANNYERQGAPAAAAARLSNPTAPMVQGAPVLGKDVAEAAQVPKAQADMIVKQFTAKNKRPPTPDEVVRWYNRNFGSGK